MTLLLRSEADTEGKGGLNQSRMVGTKLPNTKVHKCIGEMGEWLKPAPMNRD